MNAKQWYERRVAITAGGQYFCQRIRMKIFVSLLLVTAIWGPSLGSVVEEETKLLKNLTENYNNDVKPKDPKFKFGIGFICARYDHEDRVMKTTVWERYSWTDSRLAWNPDEYGGIKTIRVPQYYFWKPDIKLINSISAEDSRQWAKGVVFHTGDVIWIPTAEYESVCRPIGSALECDYKIGSWTEDIRSLPMAHLGENLELNVYLNSTCPLLPTVKSAEVVHRHYPCCEEAFPTLEISVSYRKNEGFSTGQKHRGHHSSPTRWSWT